LSSKPFTFLLIWAVATTLPSAQLIESPLNVSGGKLLRIENFKSDYVVPRNIDIWLPDGSDEGPLDVLYMHDGQMLFDSTNNWNGQEWKVDETLSSLIAEGEIRPCIVIGIWNTEFRHSEYFPQKPFESLDSGFQEQIFNTTDPYGNRLFRKPVCSKEYLRFIVEELKPFIDSKFNTNPNRDHTFIAGSSMGGLISMYAICEYPEIFGGAACLSTHWPGVLHTADTMIPEAFVNYMRNYLPRPGNHLFYFDFGTTTLDAMYEPLQQKVDQVMSSKGYTEANWVTVKYEGEPHTEDAWSKRFDVPVKFLLDPGN